jgi:hypothetical protein
LLQACLFPLLYEFWIFYNIIDISKKNIMLTSGIPMALRIGSFVSHTHTNTKTYYTMTKNTQKPTLDLQMIQQMKNQAKEENGQTQFQ